MARVRELGRDAVISLSQLTEAQRRAVARLSVAFAREGAEVFLVGGSVRALLLGQAASDLDLATPAPPPLIRAAAARAGATAVYSANERFATVGLIVDGVPVEITTFRSAVGDRSTPDAALVADLALRDFTINAMAIGLHADATATPIDPFGGQRDLDRRTIRGVGDPAARIAEDPLRVLRAVRFAAELDFIIEPETSDAVRAAAPALRAVSPERIGAELARLLVAPAVVGGLRLFERLGLLRETLPELVPLVEFSAEGSKDLWAHTRQVVGNTPRRLAVRWAGLLHDIAKPRTYSVQGQEIHFFGHEAIGARLARQILTRLRLERDLVNAIGTLIEHHGRPAQYDADWTDGGVRRLMLDVAPWLDDLLDLARADVTSGRPQVRQRAWARVDALQDHCRRILDEQELAKLQSPLDGLQLMALFDRPAGPWIKPLKDHLRNLVIDGQLAPGDVEAATDAANSWMAEHGDADQ